MPEHDFAITCRLTRGQGALTHRFWLTAEERLGVEFEPAPGLGSHTVTGGRSRQAFMASDAARSVTILPLPAGSGIQDLRLRSDAQVLREGQDHIAGTSCALWRIAWHEVPPTHARICCSSACRAEPDRARRHGFSECARGGDQG